MILSSIAAKNPSISFIPKKNPKICVPSSKLSHFNLKPVLCSLHNRNPNTIDKPAKPKTLFTGTIILKPGQVFPKKGKRNRGYEEGSDFTRVGSQQMLVLCGLGYWLQGFRCFPWLALNFHMANNLNLHPSTLQLVQNFGNLPMVAKPLYGILSDATYIGGAHRIPYILIGVLLQVLSWGPLALIPLAREVLPSLVACILLGNLGASITEVATDALVAEYGQKHRMGGLQSYAFMAIAVGGILGNLLGGCFLQNAPPDTMFLVFMGLLSLQLAISSKVKEEYLGLSQQSDHSLVGLSIWENIKRKIADLKMALNNNRISRPLTWIVASIAMVPVLSGSMFCYQMQCLHLDPSIIGLSRVIGQLTLLIMTVLYDRYWKEVPMRKLIGKVQCLYAASLLLDFVLARQVNHRLGISNEVFACCFSSLAEILAQFKILPFSVLLASLCPKGCEGSLTSFFASALCLSSIVSGCLGVGLASLIGVTSGDYSSLHVGILIQLVAALVPFLWIHHVPMSQPAVEEKKKRALSERAWKNIRVERMVFGSIYVYRQPRESERQG